MIYRQLNAKLQNQCTSLTSKIPKGSPVSTRIPATKTKENSISFMTNSSLKQLKYR